MKVIEEFESRPHEIVEEVTRSSQMMALGECCKSAKKKGLKGKTLYKDGIARRLSLKKKRKAGKKVTRWQNNGKRSNIWKKQLKEEEEWKEAP